MTPSSTPEAREWWLAHTEYKDGTIACNSKRSAENFAGHNITHVIECSAFEQMRKERDEALSKNAYLQKNYADVKADLKIALEQRERYKRALEYAQRAMRSPRGTNSKRGSE